MRKVDKITQRAMPMLREVLETYTDAELAEQHKRLWQFVGEATRRVESEGLTLPELVLKQCNEHHGAGYGDLRSPRGGRVKDHVRRYPGFKFAKWGCHMEELTRNRIPHRLPLELKKREAAKKYIEAAERLATHGARTDDQICYDTVRFLVAEAQWFLLWEGFEWPEAPPPDLLREQVITNIAEILGLGAPQLFAAVAAEFDREAVRQ
jgi:hypothetical protein